MSPHKNRCFMLPQPLSSFNQVYEAIYSLSDHTINGLVSTGGKSFKAKARYSLRVGKFILLSHDNRIYHCCWGNTTNHMGKKDGQRIGQYVRSLDEWYQKH